MYIQEAVRLSMKTGKPITRGTAWWGGTLAIRPTNTPDCCIVIHQIPEHPPARRWNPNAEDLAANDWILADGRGKATAYPLLEWVQAMREALRGSQQKPRDRSEYQRTYQQRRKGE